MSEPRPWLTGPVSDILTEARRAVLTTIDRRDGRPRSVPICFALDGAVLYSALDQKPKTAPDPLALRRVINLRADPRATILVDRWDEDWSRLAFVELRCRGTILEPDEPEHARAVMALHARYPQYAGHRLETRPVMRFAVLDAVSWRGGPSR